MTTNRPIWDYPRGNVVDLDGQGGYVQRHELETHWHEGREDETDEWIIVPARAVIIDSSGPAVEFGRFSFSPHEARTLADSLRILADLADPDHLDRPIDPDKWHRMIGGLGEGANNGEPE